MLSPIEFVVRLLVALLLGFAIGLEREYRSHSPRAAGMRTLALVAMGSALFTLISAYGFLSFTSAQYARTDPSRIAAQIVSGIGFLGAGAILLHRQSIRGLTTAAAVWTIAAIGMAVGVGLYLEAVGATLLALGILEALRPLETRLFPRPQQSRMRIRIKPGAEGDPLAAVQDACSALNLSPKRLTLRESPRGALIELEFAHHQHGDMIRLVQRLRTLPMIRAIQTELLHPLER